MSKARKVNSCGELYPDSYDGYQGLIYARVSSKRQETEGQGLDSQVGRCETDLSSVGVNVKETFRDSFTGGGDFMKRPAMKSMMEYIDKRPHAKFVVVFDDLSRLARDVEAHIALMAAFKMRNVALRCLNYQFNYSPEGKYAEIVMAGSAELHREQNRRQVIQKQSARLEKGYWAFGSKKGYQMVAHPIHGKVSVPKEPEASFLKEAIEGFANGKFVHKVDACRFLVEKEFWKKQKPERYIDKFTDFLKDSFYAGFIEYPEWEIERRNGYHDGIISVGTFDAVQKRLNQENAGKRVRRDVSEDFPMRGITVCTECSGHITAAWSGGNGGKFGYYFCQNKNCSEYRISIPKKNIEEQFDILLLESVLKDEVGNVLTEIFERVWKNEVGQFKVREGKLEEERSAKEKEIRELSSLLIKANNSSVKKVYEKQIEELADEVEQFSKPDITEEDLNVPYRTALNKSVALLKSPYSVWHSVDVQEKQRLFYFIFDEKLPYSKKAGYRTDNLPSAVRVFEEFVTTNSPDVEDFVPS